MIHPKTISIGPKTDIAISLPYNKRDDKKYYLQTRKSDKALLAYPSLS